MSKKMLIACIMLCAGMLLIGMSGFASAEEMKAEQNFLLAQQWICPGGTTNCNNGICCESGYFCVPGGCCQNGTVSCNNGRCCPASKPLCCGNGHCCGEGKPWNCPSLGKCFATEEEVQMNCPDLISYCQ